jgi:hypothetical protein
MHLYCDIPESLKRSGNDLKDELGRDKAMKTDIKQNHKLPTLHTVYTMTSTDPARKTSISTHWIFCLIHRRKVDFASLIPTLDAIGVDFLNKMIHHNPPARRITAQEALEHRFFFDMVGHCM